MNNTTSFFKHYSDALKVSNLTKKNTLYVIRKLIKYDPFGITSFEVSLKLGKGGIFNMTRFLNMDSNAFSFRNSLFFKARLEIYKKILHKKCNNPGLSRILYCLERVSETPMDLYFGADIKEDSFLFAFWLIFGGVKRNGKVSFYSYDFAKIMEILLTSINAKFPKLLNNDLLNFGLDITSRDVYYKLYYLLRKKNARNPEFNGLIKNIDLNLRNSKYFYFCSQMFDRHARCIKKKLFLEFLEDLYPDSPKLFDILDKILKLYKICFDTESLLKILKSIDGKLSLIAFEKNNVITLYLRPK